MSIHLRSTIAWLAFAAAASGFAVAPTANAAPVTYGFSVHVDDGPLAGVDESGTFSYDSSLATPNAWLHQTGLLGAFDFSFNGSTYGVATVDTGWLQFDASGKLAAFTFGNACDTDGDCWMHPGQDTWYVTDYGLTYSVPGFTGFDGIGCGTTKWLQVHASVAEPGTLGLFGLGFLLLAGAMARRRLLPAAPAPRAP